MTENPQKVYVIRHGETEWSLNGRHTGITDLPLTANGERAASRLRPVLAERRFTRVMTSPMQRARKTCELAGLGEGALVNEDLMEWHYGDYEGLTPLQIRAEEPDWIIFLDGCPNGESPERVGGRMDRVIDAVRQTEGDVALFAHGHVLRVLAARWLELPPSEGRRFQLGTATLNVLGYYHGTPSMLRWNAPIGH